MKKGLLSIYDFFHRHPIRMWTLLALLVLGCLFSLFRIAFVEDIASFLPNDNDSERVNYAYEHLGGDNKLLVSVAMADTSQEADAGLLAAAADEFAARLTELDTAHLAKLVLSEIDESQMGEVMTFVLENMPYFLTEEEYLRMDTLLSAEHISSQLSKDKELLSAPVPMLRYLLQRDPMFFSSNLLQSLNDFKPNDSYHIDNGHLFSQNGKEAVVVVSSSFPVSETMNNGKLVDMVNRVADSVQCQSGGKVTVTSFGASQVSITNSRQIKRDSVMAILLSLVLIVALLIYYYRDWRSILLIVVCVSFGGLFALGLVAWIANPVSLIAVGVASIIIGIAINYPIHFLSHFKRTDDKRQIIREVAHPLLIGNVTTVGAFLSLLFISSDAMRDLGLFSALLLVGTILFVLIFLPHLMGGRFKGRSHELAFGRVAEFRLENVRGLFCVILVLTGVLFIFSSRTSFDTNMHHINYMTKEQKAQFEKLRAAADTTVSTLYVVAEGRTLDEALANNERAQKVIGNAFQGFTNSIKKHSGIGPFLPSQKMQAQKLARWNQFWGQDRGDRRNAFCQLLDEAAKSNGFTPEAFQYCKDIVNQEYGVQDEHYFDIIRQKLADNYISEEDGRVLIYNVLQVDKRYAGDVEQFLNRSTARNEHIFAFTDSSIASRLVKSLSKDFDYVLYICGFIVFFFLFCSFGRIEISVMAFLPLVIAWIWILGVMGIFNIQFNIVNIILATFIFGMGDDYSIFVTEGLIYEYAYGKKMLAQFKNSIILSASIMFIGIGMLIFARHPAMKSLAEVIIIGMVSVVLMAYVVPPVIFKWLTTRKGKPRRRPITWRTLMLCMVTVPYFLFGVIVLSFGALFLLRVGRPTDRHKLQYHKLLRTMLRTTANIVPNTRWRILNPQNEDFEKPAIIICNHQSHFDLLYLLSLTPKVIALTNDWAWNMPLYRRILRNGDYLPANFGIESNVDKIKELVKKGYSVLVFPEGTRSTDQSVLRFHKGAFFLAEKLKMDILPIVLHGTDDLFPKKGTVIYPGKVTVSILGRVKPENEVFRNGKSQLEMAHLFRQFYIQQYDALKTECETLDYLTPIIADTYLYKGSEVEGDCRAKLSRGKFLADELEKVPRNARLLYKNCGNGVLSLLAARLRRDVQILAFDADEEAISLAANCSGLPANISYCCELPEENDFDYVFDENDL